MVYLDAPRRRLKFVCGRRRWCRRAAAVGECRHAVTRRVTVGPPGRRRRGVPVVRPTAAAAVHSAVERDRLSSLQIGGANRYGPLLRCRTFVSYFSGG